MKSAAKTRSPISQNQTIEFQVELIDLSREEDPIQKMDMLKRKIHQIYSVVQMRFD